LSDGTVVTDIRLGRICRTDVLEVFLFSNRQPIIDISLAYTLAMAMRLAVARLLGIEVEELGAELAWRDLPEAKGYVMILYDIHPTGYVSGLRERMTEVLHYTRLSLDCPKGCHDSCPACLQHFDNRSRTRLLDRPKAVRAFPSGWTKRQFWHLPEQMFGLGTARESSPLVEALTREIDQLDAKQVRIYLEPAMLSDDQSLKRLREALRLWTGRGVEAVLVLVIPNDSSHDRKALRGLKNRVGDPQLDWLTTSPTSVTGILAELKTGRGCIYWGCRSPSSTAAEPVWPVQRNEPMWRSLPMQALDIVLSPL